MRLIVSDLHYISPTIFVYYTTITNNLFYSSFTKRKVLLPQRTR